MRSDVPKKKGLFESLGLGVLSWSLNDTLIRLAELAKHVEGKQGGKKELETKPPANRLNAD